MKLIDCFMYFDEDLILEIRLNTLNKIVDKFVIVEATKDHAGRDKKLNFNLENFSKFKNKIDYIIVDNIPTEVGSNKKNWHENHIRDQFQRNSLSKGYENCDYDDFIMISDIDEIPDPEKIKEFDVKNKYACFLQKNFQSKLNLLNITNEWWPGTKICQKQYLKSPQWLRNIKTKKGHFWKFYKDKEPQLIYAGGWHFSFLKSPESIKRKISSYAHNEFNTKDFTNIDEIKRKIDLGKDLFNREIIYKKISVDSSYPKYIFDNRDKLKNWIA